MIVPSIQLLLWLGCVDASSSTAHFNMVKGNSLLIYVGGEKEQLMSESGKHSIYVLHRKGFVKLALQYGADLVPMVSVVLIPWIPFRNLSLYF